LDVITLLLEQKVIVICAGGGGIPVVQKPDGTMIGVEAVIDKDHASGLLAREVKADAFLMLTDVAGVFTDWGGPDEAMLRVATPLELASISFPGGSMGPKVDAACDFARATGGFAAIGRLEDCMALVQGTKGTRISVAP
jgi:carbamate kinase